MDSLTLSLPTLGTAQFVLARLDGQGELLAEPGDPQAAHHLLARLLRDASGRAVDPDGLIICWFSRLLAQVFRREFGDQVQCRGRCNQCAEVFEFGFAIAAITAEQDAAAAASGLTLSDDGVWLLDDGGTLRPPVLADLKRHGDAAQLQGALAVGTNLSRGEIEQLLEAGAPLLAFDIETACPACAAVQQSRFDMARHLIESLAGERAFLIRETHLIASRYGWDHGTIMALPRSDRRAYAALIESERSAGLQRMRG